jgi:8-oxo-dGTP pyrophosphatase MutT (NUDIX family)
MAILHRKAARILLLDPEARVLLFQFVRPNGERFWATPGGRVEPGESFEQAARRELTEEVGLSVDSLEAAWSQPATFVWSEDTIEQKEQFFIAMLTRPFVIDPALAATHRVENIVGHRFWSIEELLTTLEHVFPEDLGTRLREVKERRSR